MVILTEVCSSFFPSPEEQSTVTVGDGQGPRTQTYFQVGPKAINNQTWDMFRIKLYHFFSFSLSVLKYLTMLAKLKLEAFLPHLAFGAANHWGSRYIALYTASFFKCLFHWLYLLEALKNVLLEPIQKLERNVCNHRNLKRKLNCLTLNEKILPQTMYFQNYNVSVSFYYILVLHLM